MVDVVDPQASVYVNNEEHKAVMVASTASRTRTPAGFSGGRGGSVLVQLRERPRARPLQPGGRAARRGLGLDVIDRFESGFSFVVTAPETLGGIVDLPVEVSVERASSVSTRSAGVSATATEDRTRSLDGLGRPIRGPAGADRRLGALLAAHVQHRAHAMEDALLRLGLGYLWQLIRPLLLFGVLYVFFTKVAHVGQGPQAQPGGQSILRRPAPRLDRALHVLRRGDRGLGA